MTVIFALLVPSLAYGCGYRGWDLRLPAYIERLRGRSVATSPGSAPVSSDGGRRYGDLMWLVFVFFIVWAVLAERGWRW